ncbi:Mu transposase C-terminal domain-containing protein, partial [Leptospira sp. SA-E8]|uniref:Mu transposase C-terminal domain-containing protein n=1 Tax=Leptospira sp. SA-E8 TaxID=3422259 RepID=UPI003EBEDFCC
VSVRYDWHDPSFVLVYKLDGEFVCMAKFQANRREFFAVSAIDDAKRKRAERRVKLREQQAELAWSELQSPVDAASLPSPGHTAISVLSTRIADVGRSAQTTLSPRAANTRTAGDKERLASGRPGAFDTASQRYEWLMRHRDEWQDGDAAWTAAYAASNDYAELRDYFESRRLGWLDDSGEEGFRSTR